METLTITACRRLTNSPSGNPRYRLAAFNMGYWDTSRDSQAAHNLPSSIYPGMTTPVTVLIETNERGEITSIQEQD